MNPADRRTAYLALQRKPEVRTTVSATSDFARLTA